MEEAKFRHAESAPGVIGTASKAVQFRALRAWPGDCAAVSRR